MKKIKNKIKVISFTSIIGSIIFLAFQNWTFVVDKSSIPKFDGQLRPTYRIGLIEIIDPGVKLTDFKSCHQKLQNGGYRYIPFANSKIDDNLIHVYKKNEKCRKLIPNNNDEFLEISLERFVHDKNGVELKNMGQYKESLTSWPLTRLGTYWDYLLNQAQIENTSLGRLPKFVIVRNQIIEKKNTLIGSTPPKVAADQKQVRNFFEEAIRENNIDLSSFDFVLAVHYQLDKETSDKKYQFTRGFADKLGHLKAAYVPFFRRSFLGNSGFLTAAHELGHVLFNLGDNYLSADQGRYPQGAYDWDTQKWPSRKACLMSKKFPKKISRDNTSAFDEWNPENENNSNDYYLKSKVGQYLLCAIDREKILDPNSIYANDIFSKIVRPVGGDSSGIYRIKEDTETSIEVYRKYIDPRVSEEEYLVFTNSYYSNPSLLDTGGITNVGIAYFENFGSTVKDFDAISETVIFNKNSNNVILKNKLKVYKDNLEEGLEFFRLGQSRVLIEDNL